MTVGEISKLLNAELEGDATIEILGPGKIEEGETGQIGFYANPKYEPHIYTSKASIVLVNKSFEPKQEVQATLIKVDDIDKLIIARIEDDNQRKNTE